MSTQNNMDMAFPSTFHNGWGDPEKGMTLRDYIAAKAMQGLLSNPKLSAHILKEGGAHGGWIEDSAYGWADSMLKARDGTR